MSRAEPRNSTEASSAERISDTAGAEAGTPE